MHPAASLPSPGKGFDRTGVGRPQKKPKGKGGNINWRRSQGCGKAHPETEKKGGSWSREGKGGGGYQSFSEVLFDDEE